MAEIAVMVIDPGGYRFAQLLDDQHPIRTLIPILVGRLGLPEELNYMLVPAGESDGLAVDWSLAQSGIPAGAQLHLVPVRDTIFDVILKRIYKEAREYVQNKLWELAKERLKQLARTYPEFPDPAGLRRTLGVEGPPADAPARGSGRTARAKPPSAAPVAPPAATAPGTEAAATGGSSAAGCFLIIIVIAVGVALANRKDIEKWWAKQNPRAVNKQNVAGNGNQNPGGQNLGGQNRPANEQNVFGVFVVGPEEEVMCARRSLLEQTVRVQFRMVLGPFATADEARRAYEASKIDGSERRVGGVRDAGGVHLLGHTVARFRFDGKEHRFDNAFKYLR